MSNGNIIDLKSRRKVISEQIHKKDESDVTVESQKTEEANTLNNISISTSDSQNGIQYKHNLIGTFNPDLGIVTKQENDEIYMGGVLLKFPTNPQEYEILLEKRGMLLKCLKDFIENRATSLTLEHLQMIHELLDLPKIISLQNDLARTEFALHNLITLVAQIGHFVGYEIPEPNSEDKSQE